MIALCQKLSLYFCFSFILFFVFFHTLRFKMLFMPAAILELLVHSYSTVWLSHSYSTVWRLAAELSLVVSGAGRMRTTRRSWATREATTEPAKASNHNALHMHHSRCSHPPLANNALHVHDSRYSHPPLANNAVHVHDSRYSNPQRLTNKGVHCMM